jgi:hypothetical protein
LATGNAICRAAKLNAGKERPLFQAKYKAKYQAQVGGAIFISGFGGRIGFHADRVKPLQPVERANVGLDPRQVEGLTRARGDVRPQSLRGDAPQSCEFDSGDKRDG